MAFLMLPFFLSFVSILSLQDGQFNDKWMWNTLAPIFCDFMWIHFELISSIHFKSWIHFDFELFLVKICFVDVKWRCDCNLAWHKRAEIMKTLDELTQLQSSHSLISQYRFSALSVWICRLQVVICCDFEKLPFRVKKTSYNMAILNKNCMLARIIF